MEEHNLIITVLKHVTTHGRDDEADTKQLHLADLRKKKVRR